MVDWNAGRLRLAAGHDLTYHHGLELVFGDPVFVSCPSTFQDPTFRAPSADEIRRIAQHHDEEPRVVVAFEADSGGRTPATCLIAADRLEIVREPVLRYWREDAEPGRRFAPWVRPPG
ncbi:hypothetical protein [Streptomyces sp. NPDC048142]|uniref:hypothetical protein n=1 Tax=Streptomyces sp. NPDC048142 TaxID=3365501 RepID=UPI0037148076